ASEPPSVYQPISHNPTATAQPAPERVDKMGEESTLSMPAFSASDLNGEDQNRSLVVPVRFLNARWIGILFFLWLLGSLVMLGRLMRSYFHLCHLKRTMTPLHEDLQQRLGLCSLNRVKRQVGLGASSRIMSPVAAGFAKPTILVPESLVDELTESEFDSVVLHELAHIRRMDDWLNLAQKIIEAVLFFNPSVWWIGRQLSLEREIACDDCVVSLTGKSKPYAACLLKLAEVARLRRITMLAPGAVLARNQISRRIEMLMDKKRNSTTHLSRAIVLTIIALLAIAVIKGTEILPALALDENAASAIASVNQVINDQSAYQPSTPAIQYSALAPASKAVEAQPATSTTVAPRQELKVPIPPTPPSPPQVVPTPPQSVPSLPPLRAFPPVPPISASEKDQARYEEQKRKYDEQVRQYEIGMEQYRKQMEIYEGQMQQYNKEMAEYEKQMQAYHEQMSRYEEEMKRYHEEMKKFEQQIHDMIPLVVRRLISDEMRKIDTDARDRIDSATEQVSSSIAE
ncbi:MAG TPA: M56 family metallopeptidase, partial [Blastocatellia bacterium]